MTFCLFHSSRGSGRWRMKTGTSFHTTLGLCSLLVTGLFGSRRKSILMTTTTCTMPFMARRKSLKTMQMRWVEILSLWCRLAWLAFGDLERTECRFQLFTRNFTGEWTKLSTAQSNKHFSFHKKLQFYLNFQHFSHLQSLQTIKISREEVLLFVNNLISESF